MLDRAVCANQCGCCFQHCARPDPLASRRVCQRTARKRLPKSLTSPPDGSKFATAMPACRANALSGRLPSPESTTMSPERTSPERGIREASERYHRGIREATERRQSGVREGTAEGAWRGGPEKWAGGGPVTVNSLLFRNCHLLTSP